MTTKRKRKKPHNPLMILFSLIVLAACLYATFAYKDMAQMLLTRVHLGNPQNRTVVTVNLKQVLGGSEKNNTSGVPLNHQIFTYGGQVYLCGSGKLICYDSEGKRLWVKSFVSKRPMVTGMGNQIIVADLDVGDVYRLKPDGTIISKKLGLGGILDIKARKGQMLIFLKDEKSFVVVDQEFKTLARVSIPKGNLIGWDLNPKGKMVALLFMDSDKSGLFSNVQLYGYDGKLSEAVNVLGSATYDMRFTDKGLSIVGDDGVKSYGIPGGKMIWKQDWSRTALNFAYNDIGMMAVNTAGSDKGEQGSDYQNNLMIIDNKGKIVREIPNMDLEASFIQMTRDFAIVEGANKLMVYNLQGAMVSMRPVGAGLKDVLQIDERNMMLVYEDKIEWVSMTL